MRKVIKKIKYPETINGNQKNVVHVLNYIADPIEVKIRGWFVHDRKPIKSVNFDAEMSSACINHSA